MLLTALWAPSVVDTYFAGTSLGTMTTRRTGMTISDASSQIDNKHSRGENPWPDAKDTIASIGDFVQLGGNASHA